MLKNEPTKQKHKFDNQINLYLMKKNKFQLMTMTLLLSSFMAFGQESYQENNDHTKKNYFKFDFGLFVNEANFKSDKDYIFGSGFYYGTMYQRQVLNNKKGSILANIGFGSTTIGYNGWIDNQGIKENFVANENYLLISSGFTGSLKEKNNFLDHLDLEILFTYWVLTRQNFNSIGNSEFPKANSRLSMMFSPHYSRTFNNVKFTIGPFANIDLAEFDTKGNVFDLALVGLKMGIGIGF
ncbi:MAG: hypothetical protein ACK4K9_09595 [Bacteroidia bacterium]